MTIRAKLYAAIVMTILGPVITIAVAFAAFQSLSDRFDEVSARSDRLALALELKYAVTDVNGWQTAYGYDDGASRPQFERSAQNVRRLLAVAHRTLTEPRERAILGRLQSSFDAFMALDVVAYRALRAGPGPPGQADLPRPRDPQLRGDGGRRGPARRRGAAPQRPGRAGVRSAPDRREEEPSWSSASARACSSCCCCSPRRTSPAWRWSNRPAASHDARRHPDPEPPAGGRPLRPAAGDAAARSRDRLPAGARRPARPVRARRHRRPAGLARPRSSCSPSASRRSSSTAG